MVKSFETKVEITGAIGSSFVEAFRKANSGLIDLKKEARAVQQELDRLNRDFRNEKIHLSQYTEETRKLTQELNALERAQQKQITNRQRLSSIKAAAADVYTNVKSAAKTTAITGGAVATAAFVKSISTAADFEAQMAKVGAKAEATNAEMQALSKTALKLGASSSLSASEVAIGMDELAAKGMNAKQIIEAMPGLIAASEASGENLEVVSDVVTSALNSFGMEAKDASKVADIIAMSANKSAADVLDLGYAFKYAAPIANTLGIKLEELSAATGILVDKGLAGEQAGTALRMALTRLSDPPTEAKKALDKLKISAIDSEGKFKSLTEIVEEWNKATKNLTDNQKVEYASKIFGTEASTAMLSLFNSGTDKIKEMTKALENSGGAAQEAAKKIKDNFLGAKEQFFGALESAQIAFGTPVLDVLADTFNGLSYLIENNIPTIENAGKAVAEVIDDITAPFQDPEKYKDMDFGDKVKYTLDKSGEYVSEWIDGEGGELIGDLFVDLGTIAGKSWLTGFSTAAKNAVGEALEGNFAGSLALFAAANAMTGGLLGKGLFGGAKWAGSTIKDIYTTRKEKKAAADTTEAVDNSNNKKKKAVADKTVVASEVKKEKNEKRSSKSKKSKAITSVTKTTTEVDVPAKKTTFSKTSAKALSKVGKLGKGAGKAVAPLAIIGYGADILTSDNKIQSVGSAVGGLGGAAAGAAIGSVIPGVGTAVGGLIGGIAGDKLGSWLGGLIGNTSKASVSTAVAVDTTKLNAEIQKATSNAALLTQYLGQASGMIYGAFYPLQQQTASVASNMSILTMYTGQASGMIYGSFYQLQQQTDSVAHNMGALVTYLGQASGWVASLSGIQSAGQRVISALNRLESRINSVQLPEGPTSRRLKYE